jgi:hypothetical protein
VADIPLTGFAPAVGSGGGVVPPVYDIPLTSLAPTALSGNTLDIPAPTDMPLTSLAPTALAIHDIRPISRASAEATTVAAPAHAAGQLMLAFAFCESAATIPTVPAGQGWNVVRSNAANTCGAILVYKICQSAAEGIGTFTSANEIIVEVYENAVAVGPSAAASASSATVNYPALSLFNTDGKSWVVGFAGHRSQNASMNVAPAGMTVRSNIEGALADAASFDTNGGVTTWPSTNVVTTETASGYVSITAELIPVTVMTFENISVINGPTPVGMDALLTLIGGGASGAGAGGGSGSTRPRGWGGGGAAGGGYLQIRIPAASLSTTYSFVRGLGGAGVAVGVSGNAGTASTFTSGAANVAANGGGPGITPTSVAGSPVGGTGGGFVNTNTGTTPILQENGANGGLGSTSQAAGSNGGNSTHAGAGGGGGGANMSNAYAGGNGGSSANAAGGTNVAAPTVGNPGGNAPAGEGGGGGAGGGGNAGSGGIGGAGGAGGNYGGGGGGGGGKEGISGTGGASTAGSPGYSKLQWVPAA